MKHIHMLGFMGGACASFLLCLSPALAWKTKMIFDESGVNYVNMDTPSGEIMKIKRSSQTVDVTECNTDSVPVCKFKWKGQDVWIDRDSLKGTDELYYKGGHLRKGPDEKAELVDILPEEGVVFVNKCDTHWCDIEWSGKRGWINKDYLLDRSD